MSKYDDITQNDGHQAYIPYRIIYGPWSPLSIATACLSSADDATVALSTEDVPNTASVPFSGVGTRQGAHVAADAPPR